MKNIMKTVALAAVLALVAYAASADSLGLSGNPQVYQSAANGPYIPASITKGTTGYATNAIFNCQGGKNICIQWKHELSGAGTTADTLTLEQSVDGTYWETLTAVAIAPAGTTAVTLVTNITINATPLVRIATIAISNSNTGAGTNNVVKCWVKP